tara:strand:+ start:1248 stop:2333 length:1086 start_codon:yes stop_codon:yes gene_type:complete
MNNLNRTTSELILSFDNEDIGKLINNEFIEIIQKNEINLMSVGMEKGDPISLLRNILPLSDMLQNEVLKEAQVSLADRVIILRLIKEISPEIQSHKENMIKIKQIKEEFGCETWVSRINFCIFFNYFSDFVGDPIDEDNIEKLLNVYALVSSLMLGASVALPMSVEYDEMESAQSRYEEAGSPEGDGYLLGGDMSFYALQSIMSFGATLLIAVFVYHGLAQTEFKDIEGKHSEELRNAWWNWIRVSLFAAMVMTISGILTFFFAMQKIYMIKFKNDGCSGNSCFELGPKTPWQSSEYMAWLYLLGIGIGFGVFVPSIALRHKNLLIYQDLCKAPSSKISVLKDSLQRSNKIQAVLTMDDIE